MAEELDKLADVTKHPENVMGMHFMNPVPIMKLVEVIKTKRTSSKTLETIVEIAEKYKMRTGLVATSTITHATPASFASHINSRKKEFEI